MGCANVMETDSLRRCYNNEEIGTALLMSKVRTTHEMSAESSFRLAKYTKYLYQSSIAVTSNASCSKGFMRKRLTSGSNTKSSKRGYQKRHSSSDGLTSQHLHWRHHLRRHHFPGKDKIRRTGSGSAGQQHWHALGGSRRPYYYGLSNPG